MASEVKDDYLEHCGDSPQRKLATLYLMLGRLFTDLGAHVLESDIKTHKETSQTKPVKAPAPVTVTNSSKPVPQEPVLKLNTQEANSKAPKKEPARKPEPKPSGPESKGVSGDAKIFQDAVAEMVAATQAQNAVVDSNRMQNPRSEVPGVTGRRYEIKELQNLRQKRKAKAPPLEPSRPINMAPTPFDFSDGPPQSLRVPKADLVERQAESQAQTQTPQKAQSKAAPIQAQSRPPSQPKAQPLAQAKEPTKQLPLKEGQARNTSPTALRDIKNEIKAHIKKETKETKETKDSKTENSSPTMTKIEIKPVDAKPTPKLEPKNVPMPSSPAISLATTTTSGKPTTPKAPPKPINLADLATPTDEVPAKLFFIAYSGGSVVHNTSHGLCASLCESTPNSLDDICEAVENTFNLGEPDTPFIALFDDLDVAKGWANKRVVNKTSTPGSGRTIVIDTKALAKPLFKLSELKYELSRIECFELTAPELQAAWFCLHQISARATQIMGFFQLKAGSDDSLI